MGEKIIVSRIAPHYWEEPVISGKNGSGAIFFAGCSLRCAFCQNKAISEGLLGKSISEEELEQRIKRLVAQGVHNIDFITPSHYLEFLCSFLDGKNYGVPVIYNSGGYDDAEQLENLRGKVQIFLPDMKYVNDETAQKYSRAPHYFEIAAKAVEKMYDLVGDCEYTQDGLLKKGVIIRHLVLPNNIENTFDVIDWFSEFQKGKKVLFSLMSQYTPCSETEEFPELQRRVSKEEYDEATGYMLMNGLDGFRQESDSASDVYIPPFSAELDEEL